MVSWSWARGVGVLLALIASSLASPADAAIPSRVYLNGVPSPVYFNDGDSFRVLAGKFAGSKARLAGYNTLESYGNVHQWGDKTFSELYANARQGTLNARRGPCWNNRRMRYRPGCTKAWHCTSDLKRDTYGRILWWCPDLAFSQVRKGLAHVMSVRGPGDVKLVEAQRLAVKERRGMWSRGIPEFVLTSLHSFDEPYAKEKGTAYNRLVSVVDGHSQKWLHRQVYKECDVVCRMEVLEPAAILAAAKLLQSAAAEVAPKPDEEGQSKRPLDARIIAEYEAGALVKIVQRYAEVGEVYWTSQEHVPVFERLLAPMRQDGRLGKLRRGTCMHYAGFKRRYGANSAPCLH